MGKEPQYSEGAGEADRWVPVQPSQGRRNKKAVDKVTDIQTVGRPAPNQEGLLTRTGQKWLRKERKVNTDYRHTMQPGPGCFGCSKSGHIAAKCPKKNPGLVRQGHYPQFSFFPPRYHYDKPVTELVIDT